MSLFEMTEMIENLKFRDQGMVFENFPKRKKTPNKRRSRKNQKKPNVQCKQGSCNLCNRCGGKLHSNKPYSALSKECNL